MIAQVKLNKLYDCVINKKVLNNKLLNRCGFSNTEIKELIDNKKISLNEMDTYTFIAFHDLYKYGKELLTSNNIKMAEYCFTCCCQAGYGDIKIASTLLFYHIKMGNYEKSLKYLIEIIKSPDNIYLSDNLFFVYLLSFITKIPSELKELLVELNFDYKNIISPNSCKLLQNTAINKEVVIAAANQKFRFAYNKNNNFMFMQEMGTSYEGLIVKNLLRKIIDLEHNNKEKLVNLINNDDYEAIVTFYEEQTSLHQLSIIDCYITKLVKDLIDINNNKMLIRKNSKCRQNFFVMIDCRDYESALNLHQTRTKVENQMVIDPIVLLLQKLIEKTQENTGLVIYDKRNSLSTLFQSLKNGDMQEASIRLHNFLEDTDELKYEFLVKSLINLSLLESDKFFVKPLLYLTSFDDKKYFKNIDTYIEAFNVDINRNNLESANIYLDIICNLNEISDEKLLKIEQLNALKNKLETKKQDDNINVLKLKREN